MFRQIISETPLTNDMANAYFENQIFGESFNDDRSFVATARALIAPRMKKGDMLRIFFGSSSYRKRELNNSSASNLINACTSTYENSIYIHNFNNSYDEENEGWMDFIDNDEIYTKERPNYKKLDKVTLFFKKIFRVICYVNTEKRSVVIYTSKLRLQHLHYLQCGMLAYLPWFFNKEEGISELEMKLIESLRMKSSKNYEECLNEIAKAYDFRTAYIKKRLKGFETVFEKNMLIDEKRRYTSYMNDIRQLSEELGRMISKKQQAEATILGLETKIASGDGSNELMDYFIANKRLGLVHSDEVRIRFTVKDYLEFWDEDMAESMIDNKDSYIYRYASMDAEDVKRLFKSVFIDEKVKIKSCGIYDLNIQGSHISTLTGYNYGIEFDDAMPNIHTDRYACFGNYEKIINECMTNRNYIAAVEQCIASCKSLNFGDSTVMEAFVNNVCGNGRFREKAFFELPTGEIVTSDAVIEYLKREEAGAGE